MKVRWTEASLRLRITPSELDALGRREPVCAGLILPGGVAWRVMLRADGGETHLASEDGAALFCLGLGDLKRLGQPDAEGVYFQTEGAPPLRYFIEKDFPCAHPRLADALEAAPETFPPTPEFEARKSIS